MPLRRRLLISLLAGIAITGAGFGIACLGRWGPCGPGDMFAFVGGAMSFYQLGLLQNAIPFLGHLPEVLDRILLFALPIFTWTTVIFVVWTLARAIRGAGTRRSSAAPPSTPGAPER
jgi:hypothetical protein